MKILLFSNTPLDPMLGSGRTRLAWSAGLRDLGHEVETVEADELLGAQKDESRGRRARLGWRGWRWLQTHDLSRFDLIEFYGAEFWPGTWRLAAARHGRRPLLVAHTDGLELLATERLAAVAAKSTPVRPPAWRGAACALMQRVEQLAFSRSDGFVTGCELDRQYLLDHRIGNPARMEVVPLGLSAEYLDLPLRAEHENRVACLGSWIDRKGLPALVGAMTPLLRARPALGLDLFGVDTTETDPLVDFPADVRAQITVQPKLPTVELIDRLSRAGVFFFPSEYEGFGLALAEAMACGCAAVTTPHRLRRGTARRRGSVPLRVRRRPGDVVRHRPAARRRNPARARRRGRSRAGPGLALGKQRAQTGKHLPALARRMAARGPRRLKILPFPMNTRPPIPADRPREFVSHRRDRWMFERRRRGDPDVPQDRCDAARHELARPVRRADALRAADGRVDECRFARRRVR